jgi:hypothetical protein
MFAIPAGTVTVRAASPELPSRIRHTGRPVAKFRKWVPTRFATPVAL